MLKFLFFSLFVGALAADLLPVKTIAVLKYGSELPDRMYQGVWLDPALDIPKSRQSFYEEISPYLLSPISLEDIKELELKILCYYRKKKRPLVSVVTPPQNLSSGILQLVIVEPKAADICLSGNRWTSRQFILNHLSLCEGEGIDSYQLQNELAWINRSPFRQTDVILSPGDYAGTTNAELVTSERFPFRVYAGADNTGTVSLDHTRIYTGFNAGNLWGQDHQASFQWTTAPNPHVLTAFSFQYLAPFSWHNQLMFYGGYSKFKADLPVDLMSQNGKAWQVSGRYQIPIFPLFGSLLQQVSFGYDFKRTNSELLFGGISIQEGYADINQFYFGYTLDWITCNTKTSLLAEIFGAPFQITHDQNNHAFRRLRPFAESKYAYGRLRFCHTRNAKWFTGRVVLAGQATGWNLLASEQFPLGGWETVRGYEERAFNADSGVLASLEIAAPQLLTNLNQNLEFLGFVDYGWGMLHRPSEEQKRTEWLCGVGPGVRYRYRTHLVLRGDIGFPLHKAGVPRHGTHYYGGATISY